MMMSMMMIHGLCHVQLCKVETVISHHSIIPHSSVAGPKGRFTYLKVEPNNWVLSMHETEPMTRAWSLDPTTLQLGSSASLAALGFPSRP